MTPKKVTTDAKKAQLPRPRKRKPKGHIEALRKAFDEHRSNTDTPLTASDILAIREKAKAERDSRFVPCMDWPADSLPSITNAEFLRDGKPSTGAQIPRMDWPADSLPSGEAHYIPPAAAPFPWPVRVLNWLDNAQFWTRQRLANGLRRMAARVAP